MTLVLPYISFKILNKRSKITITSDFAQYNYVNQNAKFYNNVVIKYDMKVINCDNVDINIDENIAIAYSNVVVEDNESVMKAQVAVSYTHLTLPTKRIV